MDIVTESDRRSEALIVARFREHFPDHAIVAEEGGRASSAAARNIAGTWIRSTAPRISRTAIPASRFPSASRRRRAARGRRVQSCGDELFTAARGEGAYLNGKRIHVSAVETLAHSLVATGFPTHQRKQSANMDYYWEFTLRSHGVRRDGSAALDLCSVACGRFDAFWEFGLNSWDTAAGILLVREAGGTVTDIEGGPYRPGGPRCSRPTAAFTRNAGSRRLAERAEK